MDQRTESFKLTEDSKSLFFRFLNLMPDEELVSLELKNNVMTYTIKTHGQEEEVMSILSA